MLILLYFFAVVFFFVFFFSSRSRHTSCALVTGVQTCALPIYDRLRIARRAADPARERRTVDRHALARHHLRLPVERKVVGVFLDEDVGEQRFTWQAARHHMRGSLRLRDAIAAGPTRHLRPHRHDDAILGGDDVEPFGPIVADPVQRTAAARAATGLGRSEEHTSELQSLMRTSYAVFCLKKNTKKNNETMSNIPKQRQTTH